LVADHKLLKVQAGQARWLHPDACKRVIARAKRVLAAYFKGDRMALGMPKAELLARTLPKRAMDLADVYLRWMQAEKVLNVDGGMVNIPGRKAELTGEESELTRAVLEKVAAAGLTPPSPEYLDSELGAKRQIVAGVVHYLVQRGKLVRLPSGLLLASTAIDDLCQELLASGFETITVAEFKDRFGLSRKWAIPLLEHLDSIGFTRRVGDQRQIIQT
jgi:selenocysteine-specific elongation factor